MSDIIDDKMIDHISVLAKLELKGDEKEAVRLDMEKMLGYVDKLNELNTEGVEPLVQTISFGNVFREDRVTNTDNKEMMLSNAPEKKKGQFVVPQTF